MSSTKTVHQIEVIEVFGIEGISAYGPVTDHIVVIPDPSIKNGRKKTFGNKYFVSPLNFRDIKQGNVPEGVIEMLGLLEEEISV